MRRAFLIVGVLAYTDDTDDPESTEELKKHSIKDVRSDLFQMIGSETLERVQVHDVSSLGQEQIADIMRYADRWLSSQELK